MSNSVAVADSVVRCSGNLATSGFVLLVAGVMVVAIVTAWRSRTGATKNPPADDTAIMPRGARWTLAGYLVTCGIILVYLITKLYTIDFPETPFVIEVPAEGAIAIVPPGTDTSPAPAGGPVLLSVFPQSTFGGTPSLELALYGRNFDSAGAKVLFNRKERGAKYRDRYLIRVVPEPTDLIGVGSIMVEVVNRDDKRSNAQTVAVVRPRMPVWVFGEEFCISREVQLILLVMCAGALGSYVHAVQSLADFIGNRTLTASWFWWYVTRPFLGMALALIFYAVLRGGFLTGTPADVRVVNPFGAIAVAALVGMFADRAAQKLAEVFDALFKADDRRGGKLAGPAIEKLEPATVQTGDPNPVVVRISGDRLGKVSGVRVDKETRTPRTVAEKEVSLQLSPDDVKTSRALVISVVNPDGSVSPALTLQVSDLAITKTALPQGQAGADYGQLAQTVKATGGTPEYKWAVKGPAWLTIDPKKGDLKGTPSSPGSARIVVTVTDKAGASVTESFDLQIA